MPRSKPSSSFASSPESPLGSDGQRPERGKTTRQESLDLCRTCPTAPRRDPVLDPPLLAVLLSQQLEEFLDDLVAVGAAAHCGWSVNPGHRPSSASVSV